MASPLYMEALEQRCLLSALPTFSIGDASQIEGDAGTRTASVVVSLTQSRRKESASVSFSTQNGTAIAGTDYLATSGKLTFGPGETSKTILVKIIGDHLAESNEYFFVNLQGAKSAKIADGKGTIIIVDDEPLITIADAAGDEGNGGTTPLNFTVSLSRAYDQPVTVSYATQDDSATGQDYVGATGSVTFAAGETSKTIAIQLSGDRAAEPDEYLLLNLQAGANAHLADGQALGTILDDEPHVTINDISADEGNAGTTPFTFTVSLSRAYDQPVTVNFATQDASALAGADYAATSGSLTFAAGETAQTITVPVYGNLAGGPDKSFLINLQGGNATIDDNQGIATIRDDEPHLTISDWSAYEGSEGTTPYDFIVTLSGTPDQTVTVDFTTQDYLATAGTDYQPVSGTLTFAPGETTKTITVQVYGNVVAEPDKYFLVVLSNASVWISHNPAYGAIYDDDGYYYYDYGNYYDYGYYY